MCDRERKRKRKEKKQARSLLILFVVYKTSDVEMRNGRRKDVQNDI
jgi:hypothetical protein